MLVLSRKESETIVIGEGDDAVTITIVRFDGRKVKVGVDAPRSKVVLRGELINNPKNGGQRGSSECR